MQRLTICASIAAVVIVQLLLGACSEMSFVAADSVYGQGTSFPVHHGEKHYKKIWLDHDSRFNYIYINKPKQGNDVVILETKYPLSNPRLINYGRFAVYGSLRSGNNILVLQHINSGSRKRILMLEKTLKNIEVEKTDRSIILDFSDGSQQKVEMAEDMSNFQADDFDSSLLNTGSSLPTPAFTISIPSNVH